MSISTVRDPTLYSNNMREELNVLEKCARVGIAQLKQVPGVDGEVFAQMTLALRHIEDARMRYGKAIQYLGDGISVYDQQKS